MAKLTITNSLKGGHVVFFYLLFYLSVKILFISSGYDLFTEEAQYWVWSLHPDWSYYSKPPMIAWINFLTGFLGHDDSIIRVTALMFGMGTLYMTFRISMLIFNDNHVAWLSVLFLSISPFFILASTFFTTDCLVLFFWSLTGFFFARAIKYGRLKDWAAAGFFFGMGSLSKFSMFFFLLAFLPLFFSYKTKSHGKGIFVFAVISVLLFTPVIYWNYNHDWVTFRHLLALGVGDTHFSLRTSLLYVLEFAGGVVLILSPFLILIFGKAKSALRNPVGKHDNDKLMLLWLSVPVAGTVSIFFTLSVFSRTEVNWGAMSYLSVPIVLAYITHRSRSHFFALKAGAITFSCILFFMFPAMVDTLGLSRLLPLKIDSMKRMAGWEQLSIHVSELVRQYPAPVIVITDSYHIASEISFYGGFKEPYCIEHGRRMNQFDIWQVSDTRQGNPPRRAIYVTDFVSIPERLLQYERVEARYTVPVNYRGSVIRTFNLFVLEDYKHGVTPDFTDF